MWKSGRVSSRVRPQKSWFFVRFRIVIGSFLWVSTFAFRSLPLPTRVRARALAFRHTHTHIYIYALGGNSIWNLLFLMADSHDLKAPGLSDKLVRFGYETLQDIKDTGVIQVIQGTMFSCRHDRSAY